MPQLEFSAGLLDDEPEEEQAKDVPQEHPHDRVAYEVFAIAMGWKPEWWDLGTDRDIPGPGRLPFVLAFQTVRELMVGEPMSKPTTNPRPSSQVRNHLHESAKAVDVDHWAEWLKTRERQKRERETGRKGSRRRR